MTFGDALRNLIKERNLTQKGLAKQFNLAPSTLSCYLQNTREPDFSTLTMIADYFDVSFDYLLGRDANSADEDQEAELLRVFRAMPPDLRAIYLSQGKAILQVTAEDQRPASPSASVSDRAN